MQNSVEKNSFTLQGLLSAPPDMDELNLLVEDLSVIEAFNHNDVYKICCKLKIKNEFLDTRSKLSAGVRLLNAGIQSLAYQATGAQSRKKVDWSVDLKIGHHLNVNVKTLKSAIIRDQIINAIFANVSRDKSFGLEPVVCVSLDVIKDDSDLLGAGYAEFFSQVDYGLIADKYWNSAADSSQRYPNEVYCKTVREYGGEFVWCYTFKVYAVKKGQSLAGVQEERKRGAWLNIILQSMIEENVSAIGAGGSFILALDCTYADDSFELFNDSGHISNKVGHFSFPPGFAGFYLFGNNPLKKNTTFILPNPGFTGPGAVSEYLKKLKG